jgi:hypothetical protein
MKKTWGGAEYTTRLVSDDAEGWVALQLDKHAQGSTVLAARVIFWDAEGQFSLEVPAGELPLVIVEELIAEAKSAIPVA